MTQTARATKAKTAVAHVFQSYEAPLSLAELHRLVCMSQPRTAYSTVFRIVRELEKDGKLLRVDWRERGSRFEWADRAHHHHIVCRLCGRMRELSDDELGFDEARIAEVTGFTVSHHSIELEGICPQCRDAA